MTKYEKLENLQAESVIGLCIGYKNYSTDFSSSSQENMKEDLVKYHPPLAAVANFNNGYDGAGLDPWTTPDPAKNRITTEQVQKLIGHSLQSFDGCIRLVASLIAQDGLIRPAVFALEGQYPGKSRTMKDEVVLGVFSQKGARYDDINLAVEAAKDLRSLSRGKPAILDSNKFFTQDEIPDFLAKDYENLDKIYRKNNNLLSATILETGLPLGIVLRKIGKQEAHKNLLSDAILVLVGNAHEHDTPTKFAFSGPASQQPALAEPYRVPEPRKGSNPDLVVALNPVDDAIREIHNLEKKYIQVQHAEGTLSQDAIIAEEALRNAVARSNLYHEVPRGILPPMSPLDMIKTPTGRMATRVEDLALIRRQQIEAQANQKGRRSLGFFEKIKKLCAN